MWNVGLLFCYVCQLVLELDTVSPVGSREAEGDMLLLRVGTVALCFLVTSDGSIV